MSVFKHSLANAKLMIVSLLGVIVLLISIILFCVYGLIEAPKKMTLHIPPAIPASGLNLKVGQIPKATIYSFSYYIWSELQNWNNNGEKDYNNNLKKNSPYLTPAFKNELSKEANILDQQGLLLNHEQSVFGTNTSGFSPTDVHYVGANTWLVHLVFRNINRIAVKEGDQSFSTSHIVRDASTSYIFKVIKPQTTITGNQWDLQLAGFAAKPQLVKRYQ